MFKEHEHQEQRRIEQIRDLLQYYHKPVNNTVLVTWIKYCASMTDQEFGAAIDICLLERSQLPTIAEFQELAQGDSEALDRLALEQSWALIMEGTAIATAVGDEHRHRRRQIQEMLSDAQNKALQAVGGFVGLGQCLSSDLHWKKKDFINSYKIYEEGEKAMQRSRLYLSGESVPDSLKPYNGEIGDRDDGLEKDTDDTAWERLGTSIPDASKTGLSSIRDVLGNKK